MDEREFHLRLGGRIRRDLRFIDDPVAADIRDYLAMEKESGLPIVRVASELGVSASTLSLAAGGRLGLKRLEQIRKSLELRAEAKEPESREPLNIFQN